MTLSEAAISVGAKPSREWRVTCGDVVENRRPLDERHSGSAPTSAQIDLPVLCSPMTFSTSTARQLN